MLNSKKNTPIWISAVLLLAGVSWIYLHFPHDSFWYDETVNAYLATSSWSTIWEWSTKIDNQLPLHFALLKVWGYGAGSSEFSMRMLSAFSGLLALAGLIQLGKILSGNYITGWLAALFFALSGSFLYMASEVRTYGLAAVLLVWSCIFLFKMWPPKHYFGQANSITKRTMTISNYRYLAIYLVVTILLLYTHYTALLAVGVQGLYVLACLIKVRGQGWQSVIGLGVSLLLGIAPWLLILTGRDVNEGILYDADFTIPEALDAYWQFYTYGQRVTGSAENLPAYLLLGIVVVGVIASLGLKRQLSGSYAFSLGLTIIPVALMTLAVTQIQPHLAGRHGWAMWVGLALLFGLSWSEILNLLKPRWQQLSLVFVLAIVPFYLALHSQQLEEAGQGDLREAFAILDEYAEPTDVLILRDGTLFVAAEYYDTKLDYIGLPNTKLTDINHRVQILESESLINPLINPDTTAIWVLSWQGENEDPLMMGQAYGEYFSQGQREVWIEDAPLDEPRKVSLIRYPVAQPLAEPLLNHVNSLPDVLKIGSDGPGLVGYEIYPLLSQVPEPTCAVAAHVWWWRGEVDYPDAYISLRIYDATTQEVVIVGDQKLTGFTVGQEDWLPNAPVLGRIQVEVDCDDFESGKSYEVELYVYSEEDKFPAQTIDAAVFSAP